MKKVFRRTILQGVAVAALAAVSVGSAHAQDLYLIMGQSNAAGRDTNYSTSGEDRPTSDVQLFTSGNSFENAQQPLNRYSNVKKSSATQGANFGLSFGQKMHSINGRKVYLVVNARGGTSVASWREGKSTQYFDDTVTRVKDAERACSCRLKGILWHQGESNVNSSSGTYDRSYFNSLKGLIDEYRNALGDVPFLAGQLYQKSANAEFNDALKTIDDGNFRDDTDWVTSRNLSTTDQTHFDADSMRTLGERYAKVLDKL